MGFASYLSGILGEDKACEFLKKQKFEILKRNFRSKFGEIDIIAKKDGILHFIEVKFTQNNYEVSELPQSCKSVMEHMVSELEKEEEETAAQSSTKNKSKKKKKHS